MQTLVLERSLPDVDPDLLVEQSVLAYAEQKLGYKHPQRQKLATQGKLAEAIRIAGFKPFTDVSVDRYKIEEAKKHSSAWLWRKLAVVPEQFIAIIVSVTFLSLIAGMIMAFVFASGDIGGKWLYIPAGVFIPCASLTVLGCYACTKAVQATWVKIALVEYKNPVPEFALETAAELHQRLPDVTFYIDELQVEKVSKDPFLIAKLGDEEKYLEVWAEPGYKQKRMA